MLLNRIQTVHCDSDDDEDDKTYCQFNLLAHLSYYCCFITGDFVTKIYLILEWLNSFSFVHCFHCFRLAPQKSLLFLVSCIKDTDP